MYERLYGLLYPKDLIKDSEEFYRVADRLLDTLNHLKEYLPNNFDGLREDLAEDIFVLLDERGRMYFKYGCECHDKGLL